MLRDLLKCSGLPIKYCQSQGQQAAKCPITVYVIYCISVYVIRFSDFLSNGLYNVELNQKDNNESVAVSRPLAAVYHDPLLHSVSAFS